MIPNFGQVLWALQCVLGSTAGLAHFAQAAASTFITALWQGLAIAAGLAVCMRLAPRPSAAHRFVLWTTGFVLIALLPFVPHVLGLFADGHASVSSAIGSRPWLMLDMRWSLGLTALWMTASLWRAVDLGAHTVRLRRLWKTAVPVAYAGVSPVELQLTGRRPVEVCTTDVLERPSVIGFLAPRILIPKWLFEKLAPAELDQIVLHETEHLRRGDDWTNLLQKLSLVLFPLSPALVWMERRLCLEREMACDEGVIRRTRAPRAYAACLTALAEHGIEHRAGYRALQSRVQALSLGLWQRRPELVRRVHNLLRRTPALHPVAARGLVAVVGCSLVAGSAELARCPQLVAFHPSQSLELASAPSRPTQEADVLGDRVLRPGYQGVVARMGGQSQPYMTELKAILPTRPAHPVRADRRFGTRNGALQEMTALREVDNSTPRQVLSSEPGEQNLMAEMSSSEDSALSEPMSAASQPANQPGNQALGQRMAEPGLIVLTTWEEVQTGPAHTADETTAEPHPTVEASAGQPSGNTDRRVSHTSSRVTVTRLIFRMMPPNAQSSVPAMVPWRGGWIIFQL